MNSLTSKNDVLHVENASLADIADGFGTPCYVYSRKELTDCFNRFDEGFGGIDHLICYAVKANPSLGILNLLAKAGAGFDIVSGGELARVLAAGGNPAKVVFSGVGKTEAEMQAALQAGIMCFNVESSAELERLNHVAGRLGKRAPVSLRVNPNVDAKTHPYISTGLRDNKFGVAYEDAFDLYGIAKAMPHIKIHGVDCHIGSQLTEIAPFIDAFDRILELVDKLSASGISVSHIDIGGGLGIRYSDETPPDFTAYADAILQKLGNRKVKLVMEPGRALVGNAGLLLTRVEYLKHGEAKNFAIVDAAMNDLMRPALYDAYHGIVPVKAGSSAEPQVYDVVGPVCESGDFLGRHRKLAIEQGDLLAILSAGAYGMSMSSNYNTRPRAAEVMVDGDKCHLIRERETIEQLFALEKTLD
ncbi:MAG TPA: diaminopimelate decarboxylase [Methylophilaceae bacterium]|nr:diaminopimelate decarboxylase [Methylophilaceae bacterium]